MMNGLYNALLTISWQSKCLPFLNWMHEGALFLQSKPHIMFPRVHLLDALMCMWDYMTPMQHPLDTHCG
jgi:hypothetical protein